MRMKDTSANALLSLAAVVLLLGFVVMSPTARFAATVVAALLTVAPLLFGDTRRRVIAVAILVVAIATGVPAFFEHQRLEERRRELPRERR